MRPAPPRSRGPQALRATRRGPEGGFTLVEVLVVFVIIGIVMAVALPVFAGARKTARTKAIVAAAASYRESVEAFRLDHGGRVPALGSNDWPAAQRHLGPLNNFVRTPQHPLGRPYMRGGEPEAIKKKLAGIGATASQANGTHGRVLYRRISVDRYELHVELRGQRGAWKRVCTLGSSSAARC